MATALFESYAASGAMLLAIMLPACSQARLSSPQREEMITQLRSAQAQDRQNAAEASDPAQARDSASQADKADRAIRELEHGYGVSQDEFQEALEVPPKSLSPAQKEDLITKLKDVKRQDERDIETATDNPVAWDAYRESEDNAERVIEDLQIGEDVPWSRIKKALQVPQNP